MLYKILLANCDSFDDGFVASLLRYPHVNSYWNITWLDRVIADTKGCIFLSHRVVVSLISHFNKFRAVNISCKSSLNAPNPVDPARSEGKSATRLWLFTADFRCVQVAIRIMSLQSIFNITERVWSPKNEEICNWLLIYGRFTCNWYANQIGLG